MRRAAGIALLFFVALMGVDWPAPPLPGHAAWADLAMLGCAALVGLAWITRRLRPGSQSGEPSRYAREKLPNRLPRTGLALLAQRRLSTVGGVALAGAAYAGWAAISAISTDGSYWKVLGIFELVAIMVVTATLAAGGALRDRVLRVWIWSAAALAVLALIGVGLTLAGIATPLAPDPRGGEAGFALRPSGVCASMNLLAELCLAPILLLASDGDRLAGPRARRALLALLGATVLLTMSRTLLAIALGLALVWAARRERRKLVAVALALGLALAFASLRLHVRYTAGHLGISTAPSLRWRIAASALGTVRDNPLFGVGPGRTPASAAFSPGEPPRAWDAHSTALDVASTLGLPALAALVITIALALRRGLRRLREDPGDALRLALLCALAATLVDALTVDVEDFRHVWLLLGLLAA